MATRVHVVVVSSRHSHEEPTTRPETTTNNRTLPKYTRGNVMTKKSSMSRLGANSYQRNRPNVVEQRHTDVGCIFIAVRPTTNPLPSAMFGRMEKDTDVWG